MYVCMCIYVYIFTVFIYLCIFCLFMYLFLYLSIYTTWYVSNVVNHHCFDPLSHQLVELWLPSTRMKWRVENRSLRRPTTKSAMATTRFRDELTPSRGHFDGNSLASPLHAWRCYPQWFFMFGTWCHVRKSWDTETQIQWLFFIGFWMFLIIFPMNSAINDGMQAHFQTRRAVDQDQGEPTSCSTKRKRLGGRRNPFGSVSKPRTPGEHQNSW